MALSTTEINRLIGSFDRIGKALEKRNEIEERRLELQEESAAKARERSAPGGDLLHFGISPYTSYISTSTSEASDADVPSPR